MLVYLDNAQSFGPGSAPDKGARRGLNENLAREILELHTLGVGSGYTQADVTSLARILTGWTFAGREGRIAEPGQFAFFPNGHEPGDHRLLGKLYQAGGIEQGEAALADLARHPATARHIARKFAQHFVADEPPQMLVDRLARTFEKTGGDLKAMAVTLLDSDEAWSGERTKVRSPQEFLMAAVRAVGRVPEDPGLLLGPLNVLGMPLWQPPGPNGWPDTVAAWATPKGMKSRLDISAAIAARLKELHPPRRAAGGHTRRGRLARDAPGRDPRRVTPTGIGAAADVARVSMEVAVWDCCQSPSPSRRRFLVAGGAMFAWAQLPRLASAAGTRDPRLVVIVLRGALDGLAAVAPVGDPNY